jgi:hypothetical protein
MYTLSENRVKWSLMYGSVQVFGQFHSKSIMITLAALVSSSFELYDPPELNMSVRTGLIGRY